MKLPAISFKLKAAALALTFLSGVYAGQLPLRDVMQARDINTITVYWALCKMNMHDVSASIRTQNKLVFEALSFKQLDNGGQQVALGKPLSGS